MAKQPDQKTITAGFASANMLNYNSSAIQTAFDNTVSRDGSTPNSMSADFDMDSNDILNVGDITAVNVTVTGTLTATYANDTLQLEDTGSQVAPSTVSGKAQLYIDPADGNFKIIFGSGTIKTIATDP